VRAAVSAALFALLGCQPVPPMVPPQPLPGELPVAPPPHDPPDLARDLKLVASFDGKPVPAGTAPQIGLELVNTSKANTYLVVRPGDGSEIGVREPHVHFTAESRNVQGKWEPLPGFTHRECGLFDWDWPKDVVELKPGEKLLVANKWIPTTDFHLQQPGRVRVVGPYEYRAGRNKDGKPLGTENRGRMEGVPAFAVHSEPIEFDVIRPLDLKVRVKEPLKVGVEKNISDVIEVTLTNTTDKPLKVYGSSLGLCGGGPEANNPQLTESGDRSRWWTELKPGQTVSLLGAGEVANGTDGKWTGRIPGKYAVRASYGFDPETRETVDAWAEVPVEK
jgi:hypothetical protein